VGLPSSPLFAPPRVEYEEDQVSPQQQSLAAPSGSASAAVFGNGAAESGAGDA
jgi:hypothetical protein